MTKKELKRNLCRLACEIAEINEKELELLSDDSKSELRQTLNDAEKALWMGLGIILGEES